MDNLTANDIRVALMNRRIALDAAYAAPSKAARNRAKNAAWSAYHAAVAHIDRATLYTAGG